MSRAFLIVLDSAGIGAAPDAVSYGDEGSNTIGHIAEACASRNADRAGIRSGPLHLPNLARLGLGEACKLATGAVPPGLEARGAPVGRYACAAEVSAGKDTPSGHWEIAGVPVNEDWHYFPRNIPAFPQELIDRLCVQGSIPGTLGNCHASGTEIIARLGPDHMRSGKPILYTSADSVFQIAAHEEAFGLQRLYDLCTIARRLLDPLRVGRVIARPFVGSLEIGFTRTPNRRDYTMPPPDSTILALAVRAGRQVISIGKIADIFAHRNTGQAIKVHDNADGMMRIEEAASVLAHGGLAFANLNDFDTLYGHRRDVIGYAAALEAFDAWLPNFLEKLERNDIVIVTADHGCDPTWHGTDHTREFIPVIVFGQRVPKGEAGRRASFSDIGATICSHLGLAGVGQPLWA